MMERRPATAESLLLTSLFLTVLTENQGDYFSLLSQRIRFFTIIKCYTKQDAPMVHQLWHGVDR